MRVEELLRGSARRTPGKTAVVCTGSRHTYREIDDWSGRVARELADGGLPPGARVAIVMENSVQAIVALFGTLKAGGVFVMINPQVRGARLAEIVEDSGARVVLTRDHGTGTIQMRWQSPDAHAMPSLDPAAAGLAALVYTSGSTGRPKGVMLSHRNLTAAATSICTYLENTADDVILNVLPLAFTYGLGQVTTAFNAGATLVLERSFAYPQAVRATMRREHVTGFALVPTIATLFLQQNPTAHEFPRLRYITNAAAALSAMKIERLRHALPATRLYSMYGLTECQRASYLPPDLVDTRPSSIGIPIPGTDVFAADEDGRRLGPGLPGELTVQGPHVMLGYWNRPEETARALRPVPTPGERQLRTGDMGYVDDDGLLYFLCRNDDIIKTRGEKVAPREVEEVIAQLAGVAEVAVYGVPDDLLGESIAAVVTLESGTTLTAAQVQRHCLEQLTSLMVPKTVEIRDALPTTMSGKVSRHELRAERQTGASA